VVIPLIDLTGYAAHTGESECRNRLCAISGNANYAKN
jgi:hypothetical protein